MSTSPRRSSGAGAAEDPADAAGPADGTAPSEAETFDALPVLAPEATVVRAYPLSGELARRESPQLPAMQAAAAAAGGFVAGAAVVGLVARRQRQAPAPAKGRRRLRRRRSRKDSSPTGELVQIVGSRSLLLDVHLLGGRE